MCQLISSISLNFDNIEGVLVRGGRLFDWIGSKKKQAETQNQRPQMSKNLYAASFIQFFRILTKIVNH